MRISNYNRRVLIASSAICKFESLKAKLASFYRHFCHFCYSQLNNYNETIIMECRALLLMA